MRRAISILMLLTLVGVFNACNKDHSNDEQWGVKLSETQLALKVGESHTLTFTIPSDFWFLNKTWISTNENVATVEQTGRVTAMSPGNSTIVLTIGTAGSGYQAECRVTVTE